MKNGYKINEIAEKLGVSQTTVYRKVKKLKNQLKPHKYKQGQTIFIMEKGLEIIEKSIIASNPTVDNGFSPDQNDQKVSSIDQILIDTLKNQLEKAERIIREKEEQIKDYQFSTSEERKRTDTIIMSLTNRLEDIQKRLPELPAPNQKSKGVVRRFLTWLTAPDPEPTNWEDKDERFAN